MSAGWVAGTVRARALARRRLGPAATRELAASGSLSQALGALEASVYGRQVSAEHDLAGAQHAVAAAVLWDLRVLAGWLPRGGLHLMRVLAGWFEIANTDELLAALSGRPAGPMFSLGALATAWPKLRAATSIPSLRGLLAASAWGDPGGDDPSAVQTGMRARLAVRLADLGEPARSWAAGATALLVAGERQLAGRPLTQPVRVAADRMLGPGPAGAATIAGFAGSLPARARWALDGVTSPADLWRAEASWWARVDSDGARLLRGANTGGGPVLGAAAVLAVDAWRVRAALEVADRGGGPVEDFDAVA